MTYTLFECVKEQLTELLEQLVEELKSANLNQVTKDVETIKIAPVIHMGDSQATVKKEQLTKSQKRRMWERTDNKGQRQRGWDWVDVIRHLSQTGQKEEIVQLGQQLLPPPNN